MNYFFIFMVCFMAYSETVTWAASEGESLFSRTPGELIVSRNTDSAATRDVAAIMSNRKMRFNRNIPPTGIPTEAIGILDIFVGSGSQTITTASLGFGEFREITDPTNLRFNAVEAGDPVGAHFYFSSPSGSDTHLTLKVRDSALWAKPTNNVLVFGANGSMLIATKEDTDVPNAGYRLWVKGDNTIRVSGGIDGPIASPTNGGGRVRLNNYTATPGGYMTFSVETSPDSKKKYLNWNLTTDTTRTLKFTIQDLSQIPPYMALGSSTAKNFIIDHPTASDKYLVHAAIEGPENRVFYRGKVTLQHGQAFVALPDYFEGLTQEDRRHVFLQNMSGFDKLAVKNQDGKRIKNGILHIVSQDKHSEAVVSWEVSAVRKDVPDLIVAPHIDDVDVLGFGPYRYVSPRE
jgi:hypothetical protein